MSSTLIRLSMIATSAVAASSLAIALGLSALADHSWGKTTGFVTDVGSGEHSWAVSSGHVLPANVNGQQGPPPGNQTGTNKLRCTGFGFTFANPAIYVLQGFTVDVEGSDTLLGGPVYAINPEADAKITLGGALQGQDQHPVGWTVGSGSYLFGGSTSATFPVSGTYTLWGTSGLDMTDVTDATFGVSIWLNYGRNTDTQVDEVTMTIYYDDVMTGEHLSQTRTGRITRE